MRKVCFAIFAVTLILSCSDPAEEIKAKQLEAKADSLRAEIRATEARIDSMKQQAAHRRHIMDSLGIPTDTPKP